MVHPKLANGLRKPGGVRQKAPEANCAVLLVDTDLGFLFWLGQTLERGGYAAFPAKNFADAWQLIETLRISVAAAIVNGSLPGLNQFITTLRLKHKGVKVIQLIEDDSAPLRTDVDSRSRRSDPSDEDATWEWLRLMRRLLAANPAAIGAQTPN